MLRTAPGPRVAILFAVAFLAGCAGGSLELPEIEFSGVQLPKLPRLSQIFRTDVSSLRPGDELVVEAAISGERCHLRKYADGPAFEDFAVLCEGWSRPSGRLRRAPKAADAALLERLLTDRDLALVAPGAADCGPVEAVAETPPTRVRACTASDGWPMLLWAAGGEIEDAPAVYVGFGPPHLAPIFEAAAAGGGERLRSGSESPLVRYARLQAEAGGRFVTLDEIMEYRELVALGRLHNQAGEFADAVEAYERALAIQRSGQGGGSAFTASVLAALGLNLARDGRLEDAERAFAATEPYLARISWSEQYPRILAYRAAYARMRGDLVGASADAEEAVTRWIALLGPDAPPVAHAHLVAAGIELERGAVARARSRARRALELYERHRDRVGAAFAWSRLALVEERAGDPAAALEAAERARELMASLFGDSRNLVDAELLRGRLAARIGDRETARRAFAEAARLVEQGRYGQRALAPEDLETWFGLLAEEAAGGIRDEAILGDILRAVQLVRGSVFDTALRRMAVRVAASDRDIGRAVEAFEDLREREAELQLALGRLQLEDAYAPPAEEEQRLRDELARVRQELVARERELQARFPRYGGLTTVRPVSLASLRRLLRPGEALLRVVTTENATWTLLLPADGRAVFVRGVLGREALAAEIRALRRALTLEQGLVPYDVPRAYALYRALFGPLAAELGQARHLIVVADGPLTSLPLAVLPVASPDPSDYRRVSWLGTRQAISVLPSVAALEVLRARTPPSRAPVAFLGVGDPVLGGEGPLRGAVSRALRACLENGLFEPPVLRAMPSLPETAEELSRVAGAVGGPSRLLLREKAREPVIRGEDLSRYRTISFATHGLLPGELPCRNEPGLVLTPQASASESDDGFLAAGEIAVLRLDADWVILSACNTAGPDGSLGGESLSGLATAFAHAGARALLVSHWDVASEPTVHLISETFRRYSADPSAGKAAALLAARRTLASDPELAHPVFWAPFVLVGDGGGAGVSS